MNTNHHLFRINLMAYLRQKRGIILTLIFFFLICAVLFYLYHVPLDCLIYTVIICLIIGSIAVITDFSRFCRSRRKLQDAMQTITVSLETLPLARTPLEHDYQQLLEILHTEQNRILDETADSKRFLQDYYAMWVHQIKVPIQAMRLLLSKEEKNSPLNLELFKIEQYVEMALS